MDEHLPLVYAALRPLAAHLHPEVHLFSTRIVDVDLARAAARRAGGHRRHRRRAGHRTHDRPPGPPRALRDRRLGRHGARRTRATLRPRGTRVAVALTHAGEDEFSADLAEPRLAPSTLGDSRNESKQDVCAAAKWRSSCSRATRTSCATPSSTPSCSGTRNAIRAASAASRRPASSTPSS